MIPHMTVYATICSNQPSIIGKIERLSNAGSNNVANAAPSNAGSLGRANAFKLFLEVAKERH